MGRQARLNQARRKMQLPDNSNGSLKRTPEGAILCLPCVVRAKRAAEKEEPVPGAGLAITWQVASFNQMPCAIPVCLEHVNTTDAGRTESGLITG